MLFVRALLSIRCTNSPAAHGLAMLCDIDAAAAVYIGGRIPSEGAFGTKIRLALEILLVYVVVFAS